MNKPNKPERTLRGLLLLIKFGLNTYHVVLIDDASVIKVFMYINYEMLCKFTFHVEYHMKFI